MLRKTHLSLFFLTFCLSCQGSFSSPEDSHFPGLSHNPFKTFRYEIDQFRTVTSQYPKFDSISQSLSKIEKLNEECLMNFWETEKTLQMLWMTLNSTHANYLWAGPTQHEKAIQEKVDDLNQIIADMKTSYIKFKEEVQDIPLHQLSDGSGKLFEEQSLQIRNLQDDATNCSVHLYRLLDELERAELKNDAALKDIDELERLIEFKINLRDKNDAHLDYLDREFQEQLAQFENGLKEIQRSYRVDFLNQKNAVVEFSEKKMKKIDEKIFEMEVKAIDLRTKSQESSINESLLKDIDEEIARLQYKKKIELQERHQILKGIRQFYDESIASLQDESMRKKNEQSLLQELERKKTSLEMENDRLQLEISGLRSRKSKILIFPAKLGSLRQKYAEKKRECSDIEESVLKRKEEREMLEKDESLEVGIQTQRQLVKGGEKFGDFKHTLIAYMESQLHNLQLKTYGVQMSLEKLNFEELRKNIIFKADLFLAKVYNKDPCKEIADCLQDIFTDKFQSKKFDTQISMPTLLSIIFTGTKNVRSILTLSVQKALILLCKLI